MNSQANTASMILQLLLRCGMVCKEEMNLVLDMMTAVSPAPATNASAAPCRETPGSEVPPRQAAL